jgi:tetratricopeptide (TPR) repeat protein
MLRMRLTGDDEKRMAKTYTANAEAYQDYLKGRYWWDKRNKEGLYKGIEFFQQAVAKDPKYALAYSGLADCYGELPVYAPVAPKDAIPKAKEAVQKALEIDDALAEAHASLGFIRTLYEWDWPGAEKELQRAIELNPNYAIAYRWYSLDLGFTGRLEEAIAEDKRALELDPLSLPINAYTGLTFYDARKFDQAIEQERKTLELDSNFISAHSFLGLAYVQKSMRKEGIAEFEKALMISRGDAVSLGQLGYAYALDGKRAEAQRVLDQLNELSKQRYVPAMARAMVEIGLGEKDKAFEWLEKAYEEHYVIQLKVDPQFDPLRSDPRFSDLLGRMNLQP